MLPKVFVPRGSVNDRADRCPTPRKQCWVSQSLADKMAEYNRNLYKEDITRAYLCDCGYYHLSTKPKKVGK